MKLRTIALAAGVLGAFCCTSGASADPIAQPRIDTRDVGSRSDPLITEETVGPRRQRRLGLVTVGGGCSGTLINRYWVLTADHCVSVNPQIFGSADAPFATKRITAAWTGKTATPTRYVRYWNSRGLDVALIFLGAGDLGPVDRKLIYHNAVDTSMTLTKFGQGLCSFATVGPPAQAAQSNCGYRTAAFTPSSASASAIALPISGGRVGHGGDSGGPDYVTDGDENLLSIAGVQSTCNWTGMVPGRTFSVDGWSWVTGISSCTSAALVNIRDDIHRVMAEGPPVGVVTKPGIDPDVLIKKPDIAEKPIDGASVAAPPPPPAPMIQTKRNKNVGGGP